MSKLGFNIALRKAQSIEKKFLVEGIKMAQDEFKVNFDSQKNSETGQSWGMVVRGVPPPILQVSGQLRQQAIRAGKVVILPKKAVLTVDPIDERGRGYAQYHQDGIGTNPKREFITQSDNLTRKQEELLLLLTDKAL